MRTRAKFGVTNVQITEQSVYNREKRESEKKQVATVTLYPVIGASKENEEFYASTPSGKIELGILNLEAALIFKQGAEIYVDFTPAI
jgi:hypothetical protein